MADLLGKHFGRYQILEQLGEGGMAFVYKAYDTRLERNVAIKVILPHMQQSENFIKRFEREAKALAQLSHPNIVKVIDYGEHEGLPYIVMEYLSGGTLKQKLTGKPMPWQKAIRILVPIARALAYSHEHKIIHRDIKPSNILITDSGEPMLSDFGIAKILEDEETFDLTGTGVRVGTPPYMAPEQALGKKIDSRADIYSLGIVLYELITGRKPYMADTPLAVVYKLVNEPLPLPNKFVSGLPNSVESLILKALAKRPEDRYPDAGKFAFAMESLESNASISKTRENLESAETFNKKISRQIDQKSWLIVLLSCVGIGLLIAGAVFFLPKIQMEAQTIPEQPTQASLIEAQPGANQIIGISTSSDILLDQSHEGLTVDLETASRWSPDNPEFVYIGQFYKGISDLYQVTLHTEGHLDENSLSNHRVLILVSEDGLFFKDEVRAILNYVNSGGGLLVIHVRGGGTLAEILTPLGVNFVGCPLASPDDLGWGPWGFKTEVNSTDPLLNGVSTITTNAGSAITVNDPNIVIQWTDSTIWVDTNENQQQDPQEPFGSYPVVIRLSYGQGKVVILPAVEVWGSFYYDNAPVFLHTLDWLMSTGGK